MARHLPTYLPTYLPIFIYIYIYIHTYIHTYIHMHTYKVVYRHLSIHPVCLSIYICLSIHPSIFLFYVQACVGYMHRSQTCDDGSTSVPPDVVSVLSNPIYIAPGRKSLCPKFNRWHLCWPLAVVAESFETTACVNA